MNSVAIENLAQREPIERVHHALAARLLRSGITEETRSLPPWQTAHYEWHTDPFDQSQNLTGVWRDARGDQVGQIQVMADGRIYAELDVICNHPTDRRWFVEAVTAWGSEDRIKTELRLLRRAD